MRVLGGGAIAALLALSPVGEAGELGRIEFAAHCAQCHGAAGRGDGLMTQFLTVEVPDLTTIQRDNGGVFPFARVYEIIEGGGQVTAHGDSDMPVWGERLTTDAYLLYGVRVAPEERDAFVQRRILALIDHIAQLQEQ